MNTYKGCFRVERIALLVVGVIIAGCMIGFIIGCNTDMVANKVREIRDVSSTIEEREKEIIEDMSLVENIPMSDEKKVVIVARIQANKDVVEKLKEKKTSLIKEKIVLEKEDDVLVGDLSTSANAFLPYGVGGIVLAFLQLGRGFLRNRSMKRIVESIQPLVDAAGIKEIALIKKKQKPSDKKLVDSLQGKTFNLPF